MVSPSPDWVRPPAVMAAHSPNRALARFAIRNHACQPARAACLSPLTTCQTARTWPSNMLHWVFTLWTAASHALIYGNTLERTTSSMPNSLTNDADWPNTSSDVPLAIWFDAPQTTVGFFMGNGGQGITPTAAIRAYSDASGATFLGSVSIAVLHNDVNTFYGVTSLTGAPFQRIELDYGQTTLSEEIDDLCFSRSQVNPPPHTFTGRVVEQNGPLGTPAGVGSAPVSLYGSNDASLGALLSQANSEAGTGQFGLTTNMVYLRYTVSAGLPSKDYCYVKAVPGVGGAATDKNRIQYTSPMPAFIRTTTFTWRAARRATRRRPSRRRSRRCHSLFRFRSSHFHLSPTPIYAPHASK